MTIHNEANKLINTIMAAELDENYSEITRDIIRDERIRLQRALRSSRDLRHIAKVAAETKRVADLYGVPVR